MSAATIEQHEDEMVARASLPNAAALLRRAVGKGLIKPVVAYVENRRRPHD